MIYPIEGIPNYQVITHYQQEKDQLRVCYLDGSSFLIPNHQRGIQETERIMLEQLHTFFCVEKRKQQPSQPTKPMELLSFFLTSLYWKEKRQYLEKIEWYLERATNPSTALLPSVNDLDLFSLQELQELEDKESSQVFVKRGVSRVKNR